MKHNPLTTGGGCVSVETLTVKYRRSTREGGGIILYHPPFDAICSIFAESHYFVIHKLQAYQFQ